LWVFLKKTRIIYLFTSGGLLWCL
jgi:hypothetical protein